MQKYIFSLIYYIIDMHMAYSECHRFIEKGVIYIKFSNPRYITKGIESRVSIPLQLFMWDCIDHMKIFKDYLQVFKCSYSAGKQTVEHIQEVPEYKMRYLLRADTFFNGKIFVIDNGQYTTMMLSEEY